MTTSLRYRATSERAAVAEPPPTLSRELRATSSASAGHTAEHQLRTYESDGLLQYARAAAAPPSCPGTAEEVRGRRARLLRRRACRSSRAARARACRGGALPHEDGVLIVALADAARPRGRPRQPARRRRAGRDERRGLERRRPDALLPARPVVADRLLDRRQRGRELRRRALLQVRLHDELRVRPGGRAARRRGRQLGGKRARPARLRPARRVRRLRGHARRSPRRSWLRVMPAPESVQTLVAFFDRTARGRRGGVARSSPAGIVPGRDRDDGQARDRGEPSRWRTPATRSTRGAALLVELDGAERECEARFEEVVGVCERSGSDDVRIAHDEAERRCSGRRARRPSRRWAGISPELLRAGRRDPAHQAARGARAHRRARPRSTGCGSPTSSTPGDGNLHPLVCYDGRNEGEAERAEELSGRDPRRLRGRRRLDHRRARRRRRQEALHAEDVRRARPGRVPAAALRVRPGGPRQPRQGHADPAAVRRGARRRTASTRSRRPAWRSGSEAVRRQRRPRRCSSRSATAGTVVRVARRRDEAGWGPPADGVDAGDRRAGPRSSSTTWATSPPCSRPACRSPTAQAVFAERRARCSRSTRRCTTRRRSAG